MRKILGFNLFLYLMVVILFSGCVYSYATQKVMKKEKVILIHGFGRSKVAMWPLYIELYSAGYDVSNIGYSSFSSSFWSMFNNSTLSGTIFILLKTAPKVRD